jgi:hypothetical protein
VHVTAFVWLWSCYVTVCINSVRHSITFPCVDSALKEATDNLVRVACIPVAIRTVEVGPPMVITILGGVHTNLCTKKSHTYRYISVTWLITREGGGGDKTDQGY